MKSCRCRAYSDFGPIAFCNAPATHICKESDTPLCEDHAGDFKELFGEDTVRELPIEEDSQ